jgi:hypothetical protein
MKKQILATRKDFYKKMLDAMNSVKMVQRRGTVLTPYGWQKPNHHYVIEDGVYRYKSSL